MTNKNKITNMEDVIDSRDIIERISYLEGIEGSLVYSLDETERAELAMLRALDADCNGYGDWAHGVQLIRDSYFQNYAQQLAEDCGNIPSDLKWPLRCIDWEQAARELQHDYSSTEIDGVTYWFLA